MGYPGDGFWPHSAVSLGEKEQRDWCAGAANVIRIAPRRRSLLRSEERAQQVRCPMQSRLTESLHAAARSPSPQGRRPYQIASLILILIVDPDLSLSMNMG